MQLRTTYPDNNQDIKELARMRILLQLFNKQQTMRNDYPQQKKLVRHSTSTYARVTYIPPPPTKFEVIMVNQPLSPNIQISLGTTTPNFFAASGVCIIFSNKSNPEFPTTILNFIGTTLTPTISDPSSF